MIASKGPKIGVPEKEHRRHEKKSPVSNREASEATGEAGTVLQDSVVTTVLALVCPGRKPLVPSREWQI